MKGTRLEMVKQHSPQKIYDEGGIPAIKSWLEELDWEKTQCYIGRIDGRKYKTYVKYFTIWESFYGKIILNN